MRVKNTYNFSYNINEDKGTVVCIAKVEHFDRKFIEMLSDANLITDKRMIYVGDFYDKVFTGKAVLKDGDVNDLEKAKKIARNKALRQANGVFASTVWYCREIFYNKLMESEELYAGTMNKRNEYAENVYWDTRK